MLNFFPFPSCIISGRELLVFNPLLDLLAIHFFHSTSKQHCETAAIHRQPTNSRSILVSCQHLKLPIQWLPILRGKVEPPLDLLKTLLMHKLQPVPLHKTLRAPKLQLQLHPPPDVASRTGSPLPSLASLLPRRSDTEEARNTRIDVKVLPQILSRMRHRQDARV